MKISTEAAGNPWSEETATLPKSNPPWNKLKTLSDGPFCDETNSYQSPGIVLANSASSAKHLTSDYFERKINENLSRPE